MDPELLVSEGDPIAPLVEEFIERLRRGERPAVADFTARCPQHAERIADLLPALELMERLKPGPVTGSFTAGGRAAAAAGVGTVPRRLGDYVILRELGRGGMGVVYEVVQESLGRHVALKVLLGHTHTGPAQRERFRLEARSVARLHHTNIVPVFAVGEHDEVPFYAMQYIAGHSLEAVLDDLRRLRGGAAAAQPPGPTAGSDGGSLAVARSLLAGLDGSATGPTTALARTTVTAGGDEAVLPGGAGPGRGASSLSGAGVGGFYRAAARVGLQVAEALAHAHDHGVLHRDIKPSNLLLEADGRAWVTDFGLAKLTGADGPTRTGDIVGTLRYMAPERFHGDSDPRSDVYGLGATLYELLTLRPAFDEGDRAHLIDRIVHDDPPPPRALDPRIPRDLETIVLKAMAKDPAGRYASARALAEDLGRFLDDRTILARRSTPTERLWRWCHRNPVVAGLVTAVAGLLVALAIGSTTAAVWLGQSRAELKTQFLRVQRAEVQRTEQLREAELARARAGRFSHRAGQRFESLAALRRAAALGFSPERRRELRDEAIACLALPDLRLEQSLGVIGNLRATHTICFDGAFEHFAYSDWEGAITVCRVADGAVVARRPGPGRRPQDIGLRTSPDGRWIIVDYSWSGPEHGGSILAWEVGEGEAGRVVTLAEGDATFHGFERDGRTAVLFRADDAVAFVELDSGRERRRVKLENEPGRLFSGGFRAGEVSPDGRQLVLGVRGNRSVDLSDLKTGARVHRFQLPAPFFDLAWSGNGQLLAVACDDRQIYVWEAASRRLISVLEGHAGAGIQVAFGHSGDFLVSWSWDGTTRLWDPIRGRQWLGVNGTFVALSGDDQRIALFNPARQLEVREVASGRECRTFYHGRVGNRSPRSTHILGVVDFRSDGRVLASAGDAGVRLWDLASFAEVGYLPEDPCCIARLAPDGARLLTYGPAGLRLWPIRAEAGGGGLRVGPPGLGHLPGLKDTGYASWDGQGRLVAVADGPTGQAILLDPATLGEIARFGPHPGLRYAMLSPDGHWLATSTWRGSNVKVWDVARRTLAWEVPCGSAIVGFSPDGRWLMTVVRLEYRLWHVGSWQPGIAIPTDDGYNGFFAFPPDGRQLAVNRGGLVLLVDPDSGQEFATLEPPPEAPRGIHWLAFSPDGGRLAVSIDTEFRVWDLRRIRAQLAEMGLDWDAPSLSTPDPTEAAAPPLRVRVELDAPTLDGKRDAAPVAELPADVFAPR
jgi:serine/threonine protein kinase/WD40 repeat protein